MPNADDSGSYSYRPYFHQDPQLADPANFHSTNQELSLMDRNELLQQHPLYPIRRFTPHRKRFAAGWLYLCWYAITYPLRSLRRWWQG